MPQCPHPNIYNQEQMYHLASFFAKKLSKGSVLALFGPLGGGKTTFVSSLVHHLSIKDPVTSPTFTYLHIYGDIVAHFDLYRLKHPNEFFSMGFEEYFSPNYITIIEWPDIIEEFLPKETLKLHFSHHGNKREVLSNVEILL